MSLIFNESALHHLLEDEASPVGLMLQRSANIIAGNGEAVNSIIMSDGAIRPAVDFVIEHGDDGLRAVIGMPFQGRISEYMAAKWEREGSEWIVDALMSNWDSQI